MRKLLIGVAVFVVAVALVIVIGPHLIPAERLKQDIARQVEAATGRTLTIDGDLSFTVLPAPGVSVSGVRLSNVAGAQDPDMLRLDRATAVVSLVPLLSGNIEVDRVILVRPRIALEQLADGRASWTFEPQADADAAAADSGATNSGADGGGTPAVALNRVVIDDGSLTWRDGDTVETVTGINTSMVAQSLTGPFRVEGGLILRDIALQLRVTVGELAADRAIPISLSASAEGIDMSVNGVVSGYPNEPRLSGSIEAKLADTGATLRAITGTAAPAVVAGKAAALEGTLAANLAAQSIGINNLSLRLGDLNATGALDASGGATPRVDLVLNAGQLDLDALLAAAAPSGSSGGSQPANTTRSADAPAAAGGGAAADAGMAGLPTHVAGSVELKIENVLYRGGVVRQARLAAELANGALTVSQFAVQLPGSSDVSLVGFVETADGKPTFNGQVEASSDDLRAMLGWLDVDVAGVPAERLRKLTASSAVKANADNLTVTDLDLAIDTMRVRGGIAVALRDRPGFGIGLSLDKVNLDAYLPVAAPGADGGSGGDAAPAGGTAKPAAGQQAAGEVRGIAALADFDAIVQAKVGELIWQGTTIRGVNLDATLQGGNLELRDASVASIGGATAKFSGTLSDVASTPRADLALTVAAKDADALLRLAGIDPPVAVGAASIDGSLAGDFEGLELDLALQALQATANVSGTLKQPLSAPAWDMRVDVAHGEAARLFAMLNGEAPGDTRLGALALKGTLAGAPDTARFDLAASVGKGTASLKGDLKGLDKGAATGSVALKASHPDLTGLARAFAPDYRPALAELGPLEIDTAAAVTPAEITLARLSGKAGPVSYEGTGTVALGGARPALTASLKTSEIVVDWFLPVPQRGATGTAGGAQAGAGGGGAAAQPAGGARWSREPIDLSSLRSIDADIGLSAPAITYSDMRIDQPKLAATLADGTLDLRELSGKAFGGSFGMTGQLVAAEVAQMRYALTVKDTDAAAFIAAGQGGPAALGALEILFPVSSLQVVSGKLGADIDVTARGRNQFELVSHLDGTGKMSLTNAVVDGIDSCRISNQLGNLNGLPAFLDLIVSAQGGQTRITDFQGNYTLKNGIATLPQQTVAAQCGTATFQGTVDLPRWTIDLTARATFPEHARFPGLIVEQKGPLDAPNTRLVNSNAVQQYIIGNAAESLIRKLVPGADGSSSGQGAGQTQGQTGTTQQQQPAQPADQFRNLLEGLIKR